MFFSKNHKELVFIDRDTGCLEISGNGILCAGDTKVWNPDEFRKEAFTEITIGNKITAISSGVIEQFPNIKKLILPKSVTHIVVTDELKMIFDKNDTTVSAAYGSFGDIFAHENGLRFHPENIELGRYRDEEHDESTMLILCFHEDGSMEILYDIYTIGISAGSNGGASLYRKMPEEYHPGCTIEEFADMFPARFHDQIMKNPEVEAFIKREAERADKQNK